MRKLLLVLVRKYPFDSGEPFLESEIGKHLPYYDKVLVLAQDVSRDAQPTRIPPEGIDYVITATGNRKKLRRQDILRTPRLLICPDENMKAELRMRNLRLLQRGFLAYFESRCLRLLREAKQALRELDIFQYDQITIYSYWLFANANVALYLKEYFQKEMKYSGRILLLSRAHRYDLYEEENKANYLPFRTRLTEGMDFIFPCSRDGEQYLRRSQPNAKAVIRTQYLGTRDYGLSPATEDGRLFRIVSCSRITKVKGLERLVDELSLLHPSRPVCWTHIGGGVEGKTGYSDKIISYAAQKLKNITYEFKGQLPNTAVYGYYRTHTVDVFINCSYSEGLPVSLMEAGSFGIPVIATDVGGSREMIGGKNGFLLPRDFETGQLAEKIGLLIEESEAERAERRAAAREFWEEHYNAERNYTAFAKMVSEL